MDPMEERQILYFVKYPEPGKVKTRLARHVGAGKAAELYRALVEENLSTLAQVCEPFRLVVVFDPPEKEAEVREWLKPFQIRDFLPQNGAGLGERLDHAFQFAFRDRPAKSQPQRVMALGSDTLRLTPEIIREGFDALESSDCVIGPAKDGGYYLIGLSFEDGDIFRNIPWSTSMVYQTTIQYLQSEQLSYYRLPLLEDLDEVQNLEGGVLK